MNALWAQVEPRLVSCIIKRTKVDVMELLLLQAAREEDQFWRRKIPNAVNNLLPVLQWCKPETEETEEVACGNKDAAVAVVDSPAKLQVDKHGRVTMIPKVAENAVVDQEMEIDFEQTFASAEVSRLKSELVLGLWMARDLLSKPPVKVIGIRSGTPGKKTFIRTKVVVTRDVAAFEVTLVPVVKSLEAVVQKALGKSAAVEVALTPNFSSTPEGAQAQSKSVAAIQDPTTLYLIPMMVQTEGKERFMPPYWCVRHEVPGEAINMASDSVDIDAILSMLSSDEPRSQARPVKNSLAKFTVPIMTNIKALPNGTELLFPKPTGVEKPAKASNHRQQKSWLASATAEFRRDRGETKQREGGW